MTSPIYTYSHAGRDAAIMGGVVYRGSAYPASYQGNYFFADYAQNWIKRLTLNAAGTVVTGVFNFEPINGALDNAAVGDPVWLQQGPDGSIYYLDLSFDEQNGTTNAGTLRRMRYLGSGNQPPTVNASGTPLQGQPPLTVNFSSVGSSDPEGDPLTYSWNFGDGNTSPAANPSHTYAASGRYTVTLTVSDGTNSPFKTLSVVVGTPPVGQIVTPSRRDAVRRRRPHRDLGQRHGPGGRHTSRQRVLVDGRRSTTKGTCIPLSGRSSVSGTSTSTSRARDTTSRALRATR